MALSDANINTLLIAMLVGLVARLIHGFDKSADKHDAKLEKLEEKYDRTQEDIRKDIQQRHRENEEQFRRIRDRLSDISDSAQTLVAAKHEEIESAKRRT